MCNQVCRRCWASRELKVTILLAATIRVQLRQTEGESLVSRFRAFGSDAYRALEGIATLSWEEIDASTDAFHVRDIRKRDLGKVTQLLHRVIRANLFEGAIELVREDRPTK